MNKNTIIGFVLIGLIFLGFSFYQSKVYKEQQAAQAVLDSINMANLKAKAIEDSIALAHSQPKDSVHTEVIDIDGHKKSVAIYKDTLLEKASRAKDTIYTLTNDKIELSFTTRGAQPYTARLLNYQTYNKQDLFLFKPGDSKLGIVVYVGETINTNNFVFNTVECTDTSLVMRLPFEGGGYIEQKYVLEPNSYSVKNLLSFVGMNKIIPANVNSFNTDWEMTIPRMEKGYKNEVQYSKLDYFYPGDEKPEDFGNGSSKSERISSKLSWFAFQQQFFSAIVRAKNNFSSGDLSINFFPEDDASNNLMTCTASMRTDVQFNSNLVQIPYEYYFGPNSYKILKSYKQEYQKIIPLGGWMIGWFTRFVIIPLFDFLHKYIANFGIIILLMTIFIKIVVLPLSFKSYSSTAKMQILKPEIDKINEKYPNKEDALKKQQEVMGLYKRAGVSPMGGCLPMLLQLPILWAMYRFFPASIELRQQHFLWADDLSSYDSIINFGTNLPFLGNHISLFALLMAVSMFFYSKFTTGNQMSGNDPNAKTMKFMSLYMMPVFMFFICNNLSSGLSYYYLLSNLITMLEAWIIRKWFVNPQEIWDKLKATEGKAAPKSKWQQRLEAAQKMQREMQKKR